MGTRMGVRTIMAALTDMKQPMMVSNNAIESILKEAKENRIISLCVTRQAGGVLISLDNYCSAAVQFQNGLPLI